MAGEKYVDKAVTKLLAYYEANLPTYLDAVESAQGLAAGTMTEPVAYEDGYLPDDSRSPLLQVYSPTGIILTENTVDKIHRYTCFVAVGYTSDADIVAGQRFMRRYMTALIDTLGSSRTLGGTVTQVVEIAVNMDHEKSSDTAVRHSIAYEVEVTVVD